MAKLELNITELRYLGKIITNDINKTEINTPDYKMKAVLKDKTIKVIKNIHEPKKRDELQFIIDHMSDETIEKVLVLMRGAETPSEREQANELLPLVSGMLRSPEDIKEQAYKYAKTGDDAESYDVKEKRAFEAGARWICGYEKGG